MNRCTVVGHGLTRGRSCDIDGSHCNGWRGGGLDSNFNFLVVKVSVSVRMCNDKSGHVPGSEEWEKAAKNGGELWTSRGGEICYENWAMFSRTLGPRVCEGGEEGRR